MSERYSLADYDIDRLITATEEEVDYVRGNGGAFFALRNLSETYPLDALVYARWPSKSVVGVARLGAPEVDTPDNLMIKYSKQPLDKRRFWKWKSVHKQKAYAYPVLKLHVFDRSYSIKDLMLTKWPREDTRIGYVWANLEYRPTLSKVAKRLREDMKGMDKWED